MNLRKISDMIQENIARGNTKFAILPYGNIGRLMYLILKKRFGITDILLADDDFCTNDSTIKPITDILPLLEGRCVFLTAAENALCEQVRSISSEEASVKSIVDIISFGDEESAFQFITPEHFVEVKENAARDLFKQSVEMVEIEVFSYCNRRCWFCPNSILDRHSANTNMDEQVYLKILKELHAIDYDGKISYSRYNEPLSDRIILKRIRQASELLPKAVLHTNTNGDYLTREYLDALYEAGLRSLCIQSYLEKEDTFIEDFVVEKIEKKLQQLKLPYRFSVNRQNEWYEAEVGYKDMAINIYTRNFKHNGCNRGESIPDSFFEGDGIAFNRKSPCLSPFWYSHIDYTGNVVPCCNIRSDNPKHARFVMGNVSDTSLFDIYGGQKFANWRKEVFNYNLNKIRPCRSCRFKLQDGHEAEFSQWKEKNNRAACL